MALQQPGKHNFSQGFSTLFVVIILGSVALSFSLWLATSSTLFLRGHLNVEETEKAKGMAMACVEVALEKIRENESFTGTNSVSLDGENCTYTVTNTGGNTRQVTVSATVQTITRKLTITTTGFNPLTIGTWTDTP